MLHRGQLSRCTKFDTVGHILNYQDETEHEN